LSSVTGYLLGVVRHPLKFRLDRVELSGDDGTRAVEEHALVILQGRSVANRTPKVLQTRVPSPVYALGEPPVLGYPCADPERA
jgi:hypothetical protein